MHPLPILLLAILVSPGCQSNVLQDELPPYVPRNFIRVAQLPAEVRRVLLLPVAGGADMSPEMLRELDAVLLAALQRRNRFEVVALPREECHRRFGRGAFNSSGLLPSGFVTMLGASHAADALLFIDLTVLRTHRPLQLGLRAKLVPAGPAETEMWWCFDEVISTDDPRVAASVRRRFQQPREPVDLSPVALQSPVRFATYVADTMFATLPRR
jgi:hypothetical protein